MYDSTYDADNNVIYSYYNRVWLWLPFGPASLKTNFSVGQYDAANSIYFSFGADFFDPSYFVATGAMQTTVSIALADIALTMF